MPVSDSEPPTPLRLLVVDDNALARRHVSRLLEARGHLVTAAIDGEQAFVQASSGRFDVVVTDVSMGTISGVHLCRMLRAQPATRDLPILLLTADDGPRSRFWGRHAGADAHLGKSSLDQLEAMVQRIAPDRPRQASPAAGEVDPIRHLCQVLDRELSHAVIASEGRALLEHLDDPERFAAECAQLMAAVLDCALAAVVTEHEGKERSIVVAREPLPVAADGSVPVLGLSRPPTHLSGEPTRAPSTELDPRDLQRVPIRAGHKHLGELRLHAAGRRVAPRDLESAGWLAEALVGPVEAMRLVRHVRRLATTDELTGLFNRRATNERLAAEVHRADRYGAPLSVILADIDHFKRVNDTFGHGVGDEVLRAVARALGDGVRTVDLAGRWGGEEFLILLPHQSLGAAAIVAERLRRSVAALPAILPGPARVTASLGVASFARGMDAQALVARADEALYAAKRAGRDRVELAPSSGD